MNKKIIFISMVVILAVFFVSCAKQEAEMAVKETPIAEIQEAEKSGTEVKETKFEKKINLGGLEITVNSADQDTYTIKVPEITEYEGGQTVAYVDATKNYEMIDINVFNPTSEDIIFSSIKLMDDLGNEYKQDSNPDTTNGAQDFGRDKIVSPSTVRKGNLFFLEIDEKAKTLELIFELESGEKEVFEFKK